MTENNQFADVTKDPAMPAVMFAKFLEKRIKDYLDKVGKPLVSVNLEPGDTRSVTFEVDGVKHTLGKIGVSGTRYDWKVDKAGGGEEELAAWLAVNRPELVEIKPVLKPGAEKTILDEIKERGRAITEEGELIPGVKWLPGAGGAVRITPDKEFERTLRMLNEEGNLEALTGGLIGIERGEITR